MNKRPRFPNAEFGTPSVPTDEVTLELNSNFFAAVRATSSTLRRLQTGSIRTYAAALFAGVVAIVGWYLWTLQ